MGDARLFTRDLSVVIPVYRSRDCLPELLGQLDPALAALGRDYEIVLVDDASPDDSWEVIRRIQPRYPKLRAIRLMKNGGQARALLCGFEHARGAVVVAMDDDLQHQPGEIRTLVDALRANPGIDCAFAAFGRKRHASYRNLGSRLIREINRRAFSLSGDLRPSSFFAIRGTAAKALAAHGTQNPSIAALIFSTTSRVMNVEVEHAERHAGQSNYTVRRQLRLALDNIVNVSTLPLRLVSVSGLLSCAISMLLALALVLRYLRGEITVPGWTTVVVLILFLSGLILLSLGVIGEYMIRILREVRGAPRHIERERLGFEGDSEEGRQRGGRRQS